LCDLFITDASGRDGDEKGQEALAALAPLALEKPVLLPLPRLGRCQEMFSLLASIPALTQKKGAVAMDAPLVDALDVWLADEAVDGKGRAALELARALFASGAWIRFTQPAEAPPGPRLIGAMDAMLSTGSSGELCARVLREGGTVIFSGHAAQGTPGRTLLDSGNPDVIRLPWKIHPNEDDILAALGKTEAQRVLLVHTPHKKAIQIARRLHEKTGVVATAPATGDTLRVNDRPGDSA
jgi:Cft2 family RNA processing exonuclease